MRKTKKPEEPLTLEQINALVAGRETDRLVTIAFVRVPSNPRSLGTMVPAKPFRPIDVKHDDQWLSGTDWHIITTGKPPRTHMIEAQPIPHFSTDWAVAGRLLELLRMTVESDDVREHGRVVAWCAKSTWLFPEGDWALDPEPKMAICKAALQAFHLVTHEKPLPTLSTVSPA